MLSTFFLLLCVEFIAYKYSENKGSFNFFLNFKNKEHKDILLEMDLLTGWGYNPEDIEQSGFKVVQDMVVLESIQKNCKDTLKILITGGSTSDIILENEGWPIHFFNVLKKENCCLDIRVAAVAGFNSGQEFLKLIRILKFFKPKVHISYSGGNEYPNNDYVTKYEKEIFYNKNNHLWFMPYTISYLTKRNKVDKKKSMDFLETYKYWEYNLNYMYALSQHYNYSFYGILSPVLGVGAHKEDLEKVLEKREYKEHHDGLKESLNEYPLFYNNAIEIAKRYHFIYDFTYAFEGEVPFIDDSHFEPQYQNTLAIKLINLIKEEAALKQCFNSADEYFKVNP